MTIALPALAQALTERLLNTAAEGIVLAGLVSLLLRLIGRHNSGTRFAIWFSALAGIAALPFVSGSMLNASHSHGPLPKSVHGEVLLSGAWAFCLFAAWGVGASLLLLRLGIGLWRLRRLRENCFDIDLAGLNSEVVAVFRDFASRRGVQLCVSRDATVPVAIGFFRPAIVFPVGLLPQLSAAEVKAILLHELAHLCRWDDWTNLAQKIVRALFFFHPAVWWIESRLTLEREIACDDMVLAQTASPRTYALSLISLAEKLHARRGLALAQALVSRMHQMSVRVSQILDAKRPSRTGIWKPILGLNAGMLALVVAAAPYMPRFLAFQTQADGNLTQHVEAIQVSANRAAIPSREAQPEAGNASTNRAVAMRVGQRLNVTALPATIRARHLRANPMRERVLRAAQDELPLQETIVILRTSQYDGSGTSGSAVWTLCIWRVGERNLAEKQWESAIVVSLI